MKRLRDWWATADKDMVLFSLTCATVFMLFCLFLFYFLL